jgi:polysaccharide deacetylase family protein (PEP-CTERM system associated)
VDAGVEREPTKPALVLSFDVEDWHQLVHRGVGFAEWDVPHRTFEREVEDVLDLLDEVAVRATFFVLGISIKNHPDVVSRIAARGHEVASHGWAHRRVYGQTPDEFRRDLAASVELIAELAGKRPVGYRAPAFSITRDAAWAYEILAELGFCYDSSQYDSPRIARRIQGIPADFYRLVLPSGRELLEFPIAVWQLGGRSVPVGGGGYWRLLPTAVLLRALGDVARGGHAALYLHPYEFGAAPLRPELPRTAAPAQRLRTAWRSVYRNAGRSRTPRQLRAVADSFRLLTYEELLDGAALSGAGSRSLSQAGVLV